MKRLDIAVILVVIALSSVFLLPELAGGDTGTVSYAQIYVDGKLERSVRLEGPEIEIRIENGGGYNMVAVSANGARISDADCPGRDCVRSRPVSNPAGTIACLPHGLVVRVVSGRDPGEVDAVAW